MGKLLSVNVDRGEHQEAPSLNNAERTRDICKQFKLASRRVIATQEMIEHVKHHIAEMRLAE